MMERLSRYLYDNPQIMLWLSQLEDRFLEKETAGISITQPLYITGLARSGTTITLEYIAAHPGLRSHQYSDYPFLYTPYFWNRFSCYLVKNKKAERAHRDGLQVNARSPESMEEMIWAHFFPDAHDVKKSSILDEKHHHEAFEAFYTQHMKKLLYTTSDTRYVAKANYNITRIPYLTSLFKDVSILILVRHPVDFIASSIKQDALFREEQHVNPRRLIHTNVTQHYEFGLNKRPIHFGNDAMADKIVTMLEGTAEEHFIGWAMYWNTAYQYVTELLENPAISPHLKVIRFEDLCHHTEITLQEIRSFCRIEKCADIMQSFTEEIRNPPSYFSRFTALELENIAEITGETAKKFGYSF